MSIPNQPLHILWVSPTIGANSGGPTSTIVNGLIAEKRSGLESELVTTFGREESPGQSEPSRRLARDDVKVRFFRRTGLTGRGEAWGLSFRLALWLVRNVRRYDVVHLQYVWCMTSIVGVIAARLAGVPVVVTPHESLTDFDINIASRHPVLKALKRTLRHLYLRTADQLILMSELEQRDTRHGSVPVKIISHAVLECPTSVPPAPGSGGSGLRIAFLGRNVRKKGIHLIVEAIGMRPERERRLAIAGPPPNDEYRLELDTLTERFQIQDRIDWLGFVEDRTAFLRQADLLAMPSAYEGFGMVSAEAMCNGLPVVVPSMSGVAEIVDRFNAGIVMTVSSAAALDQALSALEDDPLLGRELGANGIRAANECLTYESFARETGALYRELLIR